MMLARTGQKTKRKGAPRKPKMTVARKIEAAVRVIRGESMERITRKSPRDGSRYQPLVRGGCSMMPSVL